METVRQELSRNLLLEPRQLVTQSILDVPVLLVEQTLRRMVENPAFFEAKLSQTRTTGTAKKGLGNFDHPSFYANLFRSINNIQCSGEGTGEVRGMGAVGESLRQADERSSLAAPDITYQVRGYGDFSIIPAEHFRPTGPQLLTLQLPKTLIPFARWLLGQKNWIVRTLGDCYVAIGKAQAAYLLRLDPRQLVELPVSKITDKLGLRYNTTTYWRLFQNRSVRIVSPEGTRLLPLSYLLPTRDDIRKYHWIPKFDSLLEEECVSKRAFSDDEMARRLGLVARRTIAKYRQLANIPSHVDRQKAYNAGREQSFSTSPPMIMAVPEFDQRTPDYPYGYGRCQCGCNEISQMTRTQSHPEWVWKSYLDDHEPKPAGHTQESARENTRTDLNLAASDASADNARPSPTPTGAHVSTEARTTYSSNKGTPEPTFGQKTRLYPFGYGYCQCGCGGPTQRHGSGIYSMYLPGHHGTADKPRPEGDPYFSELQIKYNLLSSEMDLLHNNIEGIGELLERLWEGSDETKRLILEKLKSSLSEAKSRR